MLVRHLSYFVTLAREQHFARAAQACNVTQSTLSADLRKLEEDLQVALVVRNQRLSDLTVEAASPRMGAADPHRLRQPPGSPVRPTYRPQRYVAAGCHPGSDGSSWLSHVTIPGDVDVRGAFEPPYTNRR